MDKYRIRLTYIHAKNLREMEDVKFDIDKTINLIQLQNGYGKTTMLMLIRCIFEGRLPEKEKWAGYKYKSKFGGSKSKSEFYIGVKMNGEDYELGIIFDHLNDDAYFKTTKSGKGQRDGWKPDAKFENLFKNNGALVRLLAFNAETADEVNSNVGTTLLNRAKQEIANVRILKTLTKKSDDGILNRILQDELDTKSITNPDAKRWIDKQHVCIERINKLKKTNEDLLKIIEEYENKIKSAKDIIKKLEKNQPENIADKIKLLTDKKNEAKNLLKEETDRALKAIFQCSILPIWDDVQKYHLDLIDGGFPETLGRKFISKRLQNDKCICGCDWTNEMKTYVNDHLEEFLVDDKLTIVQNMQAKVEDTSLNESKQLSDSISEALNSYDSLETDLNDLVSQGLGDQERELLEEKRAEIINLKQKIIDKEKTSKIISETDSSIIRQKTYDQYGVKADGKPTVDETTFKKCYNIKTLEKINDEIEKKIAQHAGAKHFKQGTNFIQDIIEKATECVLEKLEKEIINLANEDFSRIRSSGAGGMKLIGTDKGLRYISEDGDIQAEANESAQLSGAYCYINGLYRVGEIDIPFIADSPLTAFGIGGSQDYLETIPNIFGQYITFITSEEKLHFVEDLEKEDLYYCSIHRENENINGDKDSQTGKLIVDEDKEWFVRYELDLLLEKFRNNPIIRREMDKRSV